LPNEIEQHFYLLYFAFAIISNVPIFILTKRNSGRYLRQMQPPYQSFNRLVLGIANFLNFSSQKSIVRRSKMKKTTKKHYLFILSIKKP